MHKQINTTDIARAYLKTVLSAEYDKYIDTKLAGDFAVVVANLIMNLEKNIDSGSRLAPKTGGQKLVEFCDRVMGCE